MKNHLLVICLVVTFWGYYAGTAQAQSIKQDYKFIIRHTVVFKFKASVDSTGIQKFFIAARKLAAIPGVQNFESLRQISKKNNYDFGLSMDFANEELYQQYNKHPLHVQFIEQHWLPSVSNFMEIDYQPLMK